MSRSFDSSYKHSDLREPKNHGTPLAANAASGLSVNAPEFVPQNKVPSSSAIREASNIGELSATAVSNISNHPLLSSANTTHYNNHNHHQQQPTQHYSVQQQQHHHRHHHNNMNNYNNHHQHNNHHQQQQQQQQHHHHYHQQNNSPNSKQKNSVQERLNSNWNQQQHMQQMQHQQQQQHHQIVQQQQQQQQQSQSDVSGSGQYQYEESAAEMHALSLLQEVINRLNVDPGLFDFCQSEINEVFCELTNSEYVMSIAIESVFTESINEPNFRYPGARILRLLDALNPIQNSVFRKLLCLKMDYNQEENIQFMTNESQKVRGTTIFLAELYMQLQNSGNRIHDIAKNVLKAINLLFKKPTPENIKCICQTLKLCGYELELDFPTHLKEVVHQLTNATNLDISTTRLLNSVIELSRNQWGRTNEPSLPTPTPVIDTSGQVFSNEPVCYGPDGQILTEEESSFLADNEAEYPNDIFDELDPDMDLEIKMAFKDFVRGYPPN